MRVATRETEGTGRPQVVERDSHRRVASRGDGFDFAFTVGREREAGKDVLLVQVGEVLQDFCMGHAGGQIFQHVGHGDAETADARLAAALSRFQRDDVRIPHVARVGKYVVKVKGSPAGCRASLLPIRKVGV